MKNHKFTGDDIWHITVILLIAAILTVQFKITRQIEKTETARDAFLEKAVTQLEDLNYMMSDALGDEDE